MMTLHSKIFNEGSEEVPLIILHGLFGSSDNWNSLAKKFSEKRPVYVVDLRNHGKSFHADEMNLDSMAQDLLDYMEYYKIPKANLMGHSLGGKVVLRFIENYPEKVCKAIIVDMALRKYPPHHQLIIKGLQSLDFTKENNRKKIDQKLAEFIPEIDVRQFLMKNIVRNEKKSYNYIINLDSIEKNYLSLLEETVPESKIAVPVMFIKGENSGYIEAQDILTIKNYFPNVELVTIQDSGHWVHAQKPIKFYETVENYLD